MTPGDIIKTPSGKYARYEGGSVNGAEFVYLDANGKPKRDPRDKAQVDSFCLRSMKLLAALQPVALGEWDRA